MGLRSEDWLGHSITLLCFFLSHSFVALAVCFGSLSCWKTQPRPIFNVLAEGRRLSLRILRAADLIVEVAHPSITRRFGERFISAANLLVGSPTALADEDTERRLRGRAKMSGHTLYIPSGALWGGEDIMKMADRGALTKENVTSTDLHCPFKGIEESKLSVNRKIVREYLANINEFKSPGPDELHPRVLKEIVEEILEPLSIIFENSWRTGEVPEDWRRANVVPIFKKGKKVDPGNYRPGLKITMTKHPKSFKLEGKLSEKDLSAIQDRTILYEGPIRQLCPMAPNNVNTMAAASLAAHTLGFDKVIGVLVADPSVPDWHIVDIEVTGATNETTGQVFTVRTSRQNPASPGAVTGAATFESFWSSILVCKGHGGRVYFC
ncbi:aspartate dehydrogenase domain-containing protein isoform X2 [Phyllobates terribilis]|uniref:aspartate dehydrogenase domain-containing protein isoform X2 n=1 Tax=Phyllobates terribilis TaxID=111132 RepID=UPI003CCA8F47